MGIANEPLGGSATVTIVRMTSFDDAHWVDEALCEASKARKEVSPNPRVGCVLTSATGEPLGRGFSQRAGGTPAEIMAIRDAAANGHSPVGGTAYVTLEPCAHGGSDLSPCDALVEAGITRVVGSIGDPNPSLFGEGFSRLRVRGISVSVGLGAAHSRELNLGYFSRMIRKVPWVRMKIAASLDGSTALADGTSQWITGPDARADGHAWRARSCAILTGIGTVLADNPRLDVRGVHTDRQPRLVLVDSQLQVPLDAAIFIAERAVVVYATVQNHPKIAALEAMGITVVLMPNPQGKVDLLAMMHDLAQRDINELHVEAGHKLNGSLIRAGLVDELLVYLAPKLIGAGLGMASLGSLHDLALAPALTFHSFDRVGDDLRIISRFQGHDQF